jgi:hypothetical protein
MNYCIFVLLQALTCGAAAAAGLAPPAEQQQACFKICLLTIYLNHWILPLLQAPTCGAAAAAGLAPPAEQQQQQAFAYLAAEACLIHVLKIHSVFCCCRH